MKLYSLILVLHPFVSRVDGRLRAKYGQLPNDHGTKTTVGPGEDDEGEEMNQEVVDRPRYQQYTPDASDWSGLYAKTLQVPSVHEHTPAGIGWIGEDDWKPWDGQVIDPTQYNDAAALWQEVCPNGNTVLGQRELFYQHNPFQNVLQPSKADVDEWNRILLNHIRRLFGYTGPEYEIEPDACLHALAMWNHERALTTVWDEKYPDGADCKQGGPHACDTFYPTDVQDQRPYLPDGHPGCDFQYGMAAGILAGAKADIPWSIALSRVFCITLRNGGFWGGHLGPFFRRTTFGFNFWDIDPNDMSSMNVRTMARWSGPLQPHLYTDPSLSMAQPASSSIPVCLDEGDTCREDDACCDGTCVPTFRGNSVCSSMSDISKTCITIGQVCYQGEDECCEGSSCITTRYGTGRCYYDD